jgi:hypothetical protein
MPLQNWQGSVDTTHVSPTNEPQVDTVLSSTVMKPKSYRGELLLKAIPTAAMLMGWPTTQQGPTG